MTEKIEIHSSINDSKLIWFLIVFYCIVYSAIWYLLYLFINITSPSKESYLYPFLIISLSFLLNILLGSLTSSSANTILLNSSIVVAISKMTCQLKQTKTLQNVLSYLLRNIYILGYFVERITYYSILLFIIVSVLHFLSISIGREHIDPDSARYLLSTVIQSEATIFALVVTLSLIAVQQTASSYSIRTIEIFKSSKINFDFYLVLTLYILIITYSLWVLKQIATIKKGVLLQFEHVILFKHFDLNIEVAYILAIYAFSILILYTIHTLDLLKPSKIVQLLADEFDFKFKQQLDNKYKESDNPINQLEHIIYNSLASHDFITAKYGIIKIQNSLSSLQANNSIEINDDNKTIENLIHSHKKIGKYTIFQGDQDSTIEVLKNFNLIVKICIDKQPKGISITKISPNLEEMCISAIFYRDYELVSQILNCLMSIFDQGIDKLDDKEKNYLVTQTQRALNDIVKYLSEFGMIYEIKKVVIYFGKIGEKVINEKMNFTTLYDVLEYIDNIKEIAKRIKNEDLLIETSSSFQKIVKLLLHHIDAEVNGNIEAAPKFAARIALESLCDIYKESKRRNFSYAKITVGLILLEISKDVKDYNISGLEEKLNCIQDQDNNPL